MSRILSFRISKTLTPGILLNGTERRSPSLCRYWSKVKSVDGTCSSPPFTSRPSASQLLYRYRRRTRRQGGGKEQPRRRGASGRLVADQECLRPVPELRHPAVRSSTDRPLVQETSEPGSERVYRLDGMIISTYKTASSRSRSAKKSTGRFPLIC